MENLIMWVAATQPPSTSDSSSGQLDPTIQILLTVFGAALLTAAAGFLGAWLQSRRDHTTWVRKERLTAFVTYLHFMHNAWDLTNDLERAMADKEELFDQINALVEKHQSSKPADRVKLSEDIAEYKKRALKGKAAAEVLSNRIAQVKASGVESFVTTRLLGPEYVSTAAAQVAQAMSEGGANKMRTAIAHTEAEMRRALKITY